MSRNGTETARQKGCACASPARIAPQAGNST